VADKPPKVSYLPDIPGVQNSLEGMYLYIKEVIITLLAVEQRHCLRLVEASRSVRKGTMATLAK
jgi:hypothetical protein